MAKRAPGWLTDDGRDFSTKAAAERWEMQLAFATKRVEQTQEIRQERRRVQSIRRLALSLEAYHKLMEFDEPKDSTPKESTKSAKKA